MVKKHYQLIFSIMLGAMLLMTSAKAANYGSRYHYDNSSEEMSQREAGGFGAHAFHGSLGFGAMLAPEFEGSDKYEVRPLPIIDLRYGRHFFLQPVTVWA